MHDDAARWDARHRDSARAEARPPDVLVAHPHLVDHLPGPGRALDLACGTGAQTLWLASIGHRVTALDVSPVAVDATLDALGHLGDPDARARVDLRTVDLDEGLPTDLEPFDVVVCQRFRDPGLYRPIVDALRPGGLAIVTVLSAVGLDGEPGPFHAPPGELVEAFTRADTEIVLAVEADAAASVVVRRL